MFSENRVVLWSFCFGLVLSLPFALSTKNEEILRPFQCRYGIEVHEFEQGCLIPNECEVEVLPLLETPFPFQFETKHNIYLKDG
jgi:hypothetical protein